MVRDARFARSMSRRSDEMAEAAAPISQELLEILVDPGDKGPLELVTESEGKAWLVNRRNGNRYPIEDGIPVMLLEEGEKWRDTSIIGK
jgi:uncharacterized protein YbaR (Trm112 family)